MGTRGAFGFFVDGKSKITYNHWDSYPSGLGDQISKFLLDWRGKEDELRQLVSALRVVDEHSTPTAEDIERLKQYADTSVSSQRLDEWYVLLRKTQGDLELTLKAGVMLDSEEFLQDSLFCEWAYVINLDAGILEVYRGFQTKAHTIGRYAQIPVALASRMTRPSRRTVGGDTYYPVKLTAKIPFDEVPELLSSIINESSGRRATRRERKRSRKKNDNKKVA